MKNTYLERYKDCSTPVKSIITFFADRNDTLSQAGIAFMITRLSEKKQLNTENICIIDNFSDKGRDPYRELKRP